MTNEGIPHDPREIEIRDGIRWIVINEPIGKTVVGPVADDLAAAEESDE